MKTSSLCVHVILFIIVFCGLAYGCMYGPPFRTVCETFSHADLVMVGKVESVSEKDYVQRVVINVAKTFKGANVKRIVLNQHQSTCDWDFSDSKGKTLLLYLVRDQKSGTFSAIAEGMGGEVANESENLSWLNKLPKSIKRTRISGVISLYRENPFEFLNFVDGVKVRISNEKNSFEVVTDRSGMYEVWDVPNGKYKISQEIPDKYKLDLVLSRGDVDFREISQYEVDLKDFTVNITGQLRCGGADYVLKRTP